MAEIKISLTIQLPGATMYNHQECTKEIKGKKVPDFSKFNKNTMTISNGKTSEKINFSTRKAKPATQVMYITDESIEYFRSTPPTGFTGNYKGLSLMQKLQAHFDQIAEDLGGEVLTFQFID